MARSTEGKVALQFPWQQISNAAFTTFALDASGERFAHVFRAPKTGSIRYCRFRVGAVTTSATLRVSAFTVDPATGFPLAQIAGASPGTVTPTTFGAWEVTLGADAAVTAGDVVAIVIEFDSAIGSMLLGRYATNRAFPYVATYNGAAWSKSTGLPALVVGYADGTFPMVDSAMNPSFASTTYNPSSTPYDEYGVTWTPDTPVRLRGVEAYLALVSTATNFDVVVYQGTTVLASKSFDGHVLSIITATQHQLPLDTPVYLEAGQQYRLVIKPTVASQGIQLFWSLINSAAETEAWNGSDYRLTRRLDAGAWEEDTTAVAWMAPVFDEIQDGTGPDITGSYTISGVVTQAGTPVSGATVRLIRQSDNGIKSTTTNALGQYSFSVASGHVYHAIAEWTNSGQKYNAKSVWDLTPVAP